MYLEINLLVPESPTESSESSTRFLSAEEQPHCSHPVPWLASSQDRTPPDGFNAKQLHTHQSAGRQTIMSPFPTAWASCLTSAAADVGMNVTSPLLVLPCFLLTWPHGQKYQPTPNSPAGIDLQNKPQELPPPSSWGRLHNSKLPASPARLFSGLTALVLHHRRPGRSPRQDLHAPLQKALAPSSASTYTA